MDVLRSVFMVNKNLLFPPSYLMFIYRAFLLLNPSFIFVSYNCQDYIEGMLDAADVEYESTLFPSDFIPENRGNRVWE